MNAPIVKRAKNSVFVTGSRGEVELRLGFQIERGESRRIGLTTREARLVAYALLSEAERAEAL